MLRPPMAASTAGPRLCGPHGRWWASAIVVAAVGVLAPQTAHANPGQARRLAGVEAQGPATRSVTGLHHNPATLAKMPGFQFATVVAGGIDHLAVRRTPIDAQGAPTGDPGDPVNIVNPAGGYFIGASFMLDPVAIGAGVYELSSRYRPISEDPQML